VFFAALITNSNAAIGLLHEAHTPEIPNNLKGKEGNKIYFPV